MQAHIDYEYDTIALNKIGAKLQCLTTYQWSQRQLLSVETAIPNHSMKGGNNYVATKPQETVNKGDAEDKKRKAVEAASPTPKAKEPKVNNKPTKTHPDKPHDKSSRLSDLSGCPGQASLPDSSQSAPARDQIEVWIDDDTAVEQGFIGTGHKPYWPPLPNLYTEPKLDDDLLDGHNWLYQEHGKAIRHTTEPLPPRTNIINFTDKSEYA
jgi:hypothetical protein